VFVIDEGHINKVILPSYPAIMAKYLFGFENLTGIDSISMILIVLIKRKILTSQILPVLSPEPETKYFPSELKDKSKIAS